MHDTPLVGAKNVLDDISERNAPSDYVLNAMREARVVKQLGTLAGGEGGGGPFP